jgi:sulfate permease, SulP family
LIGSTLGTISGGDPTRFTALAAGTAILVGLIAIIAWLVKAGSIINFISESVMIGFKCGVALFLASTQLPKLCGIPAAHGDFWENSGTFLKHLNETNRAALTIGGTALVVLVFGKIFLTKLPMALLVVVAGIVASRRLGLDARGVKLLGEVPQGLPDLGLPAVRWEDLNEMLPLAFACFLLAAVETAAIGRTFAAKHGRRLDANQEFLALGVSNLAAGFGQGFPISGGMSQSVVNEGGGRVRRCPAPSRRHSFWWWCFSSRSCCLRCPNPCWRRLCWWRWRAWSVCPPSGICGAVIAVNSSSQWPPCLACWGRACCVA